MNKITVTFPSLSENESLARSIASIFSLKLNPSVSEVEDIKTAVSEGVTNCIVHGYPNKVGEITMELYINDKNLHINIFDKGVGIENLSKALEPYYTTKIEEERSGMGFTIMKTFMNEVKVESSLNNGTKVYMIKTINCNNA